MSSKNILVGLLLILAGILIGLSSFDIIDFDVFFPGWWTLFIIVPSVVGLFYEGDKTWNFVGLFIGCFLFLLCQPFFDVEVLWKLFFPGLLVICGISIMFRTKNKVTYDKSKKEPEAIVEEVIISKNEEKKKENNKKEVILEVSSIFKNTTTDLSERKFNDGDIVKVSSFFGEAKIILPDDVNVKIESGILFGNVYNDKINNDNNKITIKLDCGIIFGSVYVKENKA